MLMLILPITLVALTKILHCSALFSSSLGQYHILCLGAQGMCEGILTLQPGEPVVNWNKLGNTQTVIMLPSIQQQCQLPGIKKRPGMSFAFRNKGDIRGGLVLLRKSALLSAHFQEQILACALCITSNEASFKCNLGSKFLHSPKLPKSDI